MSNHNGNNHNGVSSDPAEKQKYRRDLARALISEFMLILQGQEKLHGPAFSEALLGTYLASLISSVTYDALKGQNERLHPEKVTESIDEAAFAKLKTMIQDAISTGLEAGYGAADPNSVPECSVTIECMEESGVKD